MSYKLIDILEAGIVDDSGVALASGTVTVYQAGTTTLQTVYQDRAATLPHSNPLTLDAAGRAYAFTDKRIKLVIETSAGASLRTVDNVGEGDGELTGTEVATGSTILTESSTNTVTNKTISANQNTITCIELQVEVFS